MKNEKVIYLKKPTFEESNKLIKKSISLNRLLEIFGECVIDYEGRASSYLGLGDRIVFIKPDGALLVHTNTKREPINWQPPGSKISTKLMKEKLCLISKRKNPKEKLKISFKEIYSLSSFNLVHEEELELNRSEEEMGDLITKKPWIVEEGFKIIEREKEIDLGYIDIFGEDKENKKVIIELKRKKIGISAVSQLDRYFDSLKNKFNDLRAILIGPSLSKKAENLVKEKELEFIKLKPEACELGTDLGEFT